MKAAVAATTTVVDDAAALLQKEASESQKLRRREAPLEVWLGLCFFLLRMAASLFAGHLGFLGYL